MQAAYTAVINLDTHLLRHHNVPAAIRKQVTERFSQFKLVDPSEIELPDELAQPNVPSYSANNPVGRD
jgi:hypothetical protein